MGVSDSDEKSIECFAGNMHVGRLTEVYRVSLNDQEDEVVKWCPVCGAVVVDLEVDGRAYPGRIGKMRFAKLLGLLKR